MDDGWILPPWEASPLCQREENATKDIQTDDDFPCVVTMVAVVVALVVMAGDVGVYL